MNKSKLRFLLVTLSTVLLIFFIVSIFLSAFYKDIAREVITANLFLLVFVTIFLEAVPQWVIPHAVMIVLYSAGMPVAPVLLYTILGSLIGSIGAFELGKRYGTTLVLGFVTEEQLVNIKQWMNRFGKWFIFLAAIFPLPFIPIVFGTIECRRRIFLGYGVLMRVLSFVFVAWFYWLGFF